MQFFLTFDTIHTRRSHHTHTSAAESSAPARRPPSGRGPTPVFSRGAAVTRPKSKRARLTARVPHGPRSYSYSHGTAPRHRTAHRGTRLLPSSGSATAPAVSCVSTLCDSLVSHSRERSDQTHVTTEDTRRDARRERAASDARRSARRSRTSRRRGRGEPGCSASLYNTRMWYDGEGAHAPLRVAQSASDVNPHPILPRAVLAAPGCIALSSPRSPRVAPPLRKPPERRQPPRRERLAARRRPPGSCPPRETCAAGRTPSKARRSPPSAGAS